MEEVMKVLSFSFLRPTALFCCLIGVLAFSTHQTIYSRSWHEPLEVVVYPINGDDSLQTHNYINTLADESFTEIETWISREANRYQLALDKPLQITLGDRVKSLPPALPSDQNVLAVIWWGLKLRHWVYFNTPDDRSNLRRVRVFIAYYQGEGDKPLQHSVGLQKGLIGVVHAFALTEQSAQNNIVIAHEILHTVGATDKYTWSGTPVYPEGFANAGRVPLYPQRYAEIMAGQIPTSSYSSYMASSLRSTQINPITAREIAWIE